MCRSFVRQTSSTLLHVSFFRLADAFFRSSDAFFPSTDAFYSTSCVILSYVRRVLFSGRCVLSFVRCILLLVRINFFCIYGFRFSVCAVLFDCCSVCLLCCWVLLFKPVVHLYKFVLFYRGFRPKPWLTFCLNTKSKQKSQDYARFTRKTYAQLAKTVQTRSFVAQTGQFQTPTSLVFRFIGRGQSLPSCVQYNVFCISIENIYRMNHGYL